MKAEEARRLMSENPNTLEAIFREIRYMAQQGYDSMLIWGHIAEEYKDKFLSLGYSILPGELAMYTLSWGDTEPTYFYEPQIKPL